MKKIIKNSWESVDEEEVNSQMKRKIIHGEKLMIVKMKFKDGFIVPMHSHMNEQITQVNKGTIRFWLNSEESNPIDVNEGDFIIIPGSKQTIKDQIFLETSGLSKDIKEYSKNKGHIIGICGGLQMLGTKLKDPFFKEGSKTNSKNQINGLGLLPLKTTFFEKKLTRQIKSESLWPCKSEVKGFEIHNGKTELDNFQKSFKISPIFKDINLGWYKENNEGGTIAGTYIHGIFENDNWRNEYINLIRKSKNLPNLEVKSISYKVKRDSIINHLANEFDKHLNITSVLS